MAEDLLFSGWVLLHDMAIHHVTTIGSGVTDSLRGFNHDTPSRRRSGGKSIARRGRVCWKKVTTTLGSMS